jgi:orotate phosphoribosyltransferase
MPPETPAWENPSMPIPVDDYRNRFLKLALRADALRFGEFTLKSGRNSPYFFNAGRFDSGAALAALATCYADALDAAGAEFDLLFGPAYKGIPLATALACEYARRGRDLPLAFNRKEAKAHGEGGSLIGAALAGRKVLIVDDVITAGTAIREALAIIAEAGGTAAGIVIALDRQERVREDDGTAASRTSAAQAVANAYALPVVAVASLGDLLAFTDESAELSAHRNALLAYRARYGIA